MSRVNRIVSIVVLTAFLCNSFLFDTAIAQELNFPRATLATPKFTDDIIDPQNPVIKAISVFFLCWTTSIERKVGQITIEALRNESVVPDDVLDKFRKEGFLIYRHELTEGLDGNIVIKVRHGGKIYIIEYNPTGRTIIYPEGNPPREAVPAVPVGILKNMKRDGIAQIAVINGMNFNKVISIDINQAISFAETKQLFLKGRDFYLFGGGVPADRADQTPVASLTNEQKVHALLFKYPAQTVHIRTVAADSVVPVDDIRIIIKARIKKEGSWVTIDKDLITIPQNIKKPARSSEEARRIDLVKGKLKFPLPLEYLSKVTNITEEVLKATLKNKNFGFSTIMEMNGVMDYVSGKFEVERSKLPDATLAREEILIGIPFQATPIATAVRKQAAPVEKEITIIDEPKNPIQPKDVAKPFGVVNIEQFKKDVHGWLGEKDLKVLLKIGQDKGAAVIVDKIKMVESLIAKGYGIKNGIDLRIATAESKHEVTYVGVYKDGTGIVVFSLANQKMLYPWSALKSIEILKTGPVKIAPQLSPEALATKFSKEVQGLLKANLAQLRGLAEKIGVDGTNVLEIIAGLIEKSYHIYTGSKLILTSVNNHTRNVVYLGVTEKGIKVRLGDGKETEFPWGHLKALVVVKDTQKSVVLSKPANAVVSSDKKITGSATTEAKTTGLNFEFMSGPDNEAKSSSPATLPGKTVTTISATKPVTQKPAVKPVETKPADMPVIITGTPDQIASEFKAYVQKLFDTVQTSKQDLVDAANAFMVGDDSEKEREILVPSAVERRYRIHSYNKHKNQAGDKIKLTGTNGVVEGELIGFCKTGIKIRLPNAKVETTYLWDALKTFEDLTNPIKPAPETDKTGAKPLAADKPADGAVVSAPIELPSENKPVHISELPGNLGPNDKNLDSRGGPTKRHAKGPLGEAFGQRDLAGTVRPEVIARNIVNEIASTNNIAPMLGEKIWQRSEKYNLIMPAQFYKDRDFGNDLSKYGNRFNFECFSGTVTDPAIMIQNILGRVRSGEEANTIVLLPLVKDLTESHVRALTEKGVRFMPINLVDFYDIKEKDETTRDRFREHTYAAMLLFRQANEGMDSSMYTGITSYINMHFVLDGMTVGEYVDAIKRGDAAKLIKGYLSYRCFELYDLVKEHRNISHSLIFA